MAKPPVIEDAEMVNAFKVAAIGGQPPARADVFNNIEKFYNPKRRHGTIGVTSPIEFERRHFQRLTGVLDSRGGSGSRTGAFS